MSFFTLPLELRRMVYKHLCPPVLHFPLSPARDGLQLLATSMTTKVEYLATLRTPTSYAVHVDCLHTMEDFFKWIHPRTENGPPHVTRLHVVGPLALAGYSMIVTFLEIHGAVISSSYGPTWCFPPVDGAKGNGRPPRFFSYAADLQR